MPIIRPRVRLRQPSRGGRGFAPLAPQDDRLSDLPGFGPDPGNLRARCYVPADLEGPAPLVVVLHGCTQDAAVYDHGSGWSTLADRHGFILLFPEQRRANNPMLCFNWFSPDDTRRNAGEAASIRAMVEAIGSLHDVDPARVFVTGLSAGGAMASVMLAAYPEVFAGGAIIAGVAYGCAGDVGEAFECMGGRARSSGRDLGRSVRGASRHGGPWPRVQVWQGGADHIVVPSNGEAIVAQWTDVHGLPAEPHRLDRVEGHPRRTWLGASGEPLVEHYLIAGMDHGVPLAAAGDDPIGAAGAHMLEVGLSSTARIAAFFGIAPERQARPATPAAALAPPTSRPAAEAKPAGGPQQVIEKALRAAGLMR
jgi:poly(hydroxyalkanoate) depolymerase family esterase